MDCSPPGSSVHGVLQARILERVATLLLQDLPDPGIEPHSLMSPASGGRFFTTGATWEALLGRTYGQKGVKEPAQHQPGQALGEMPSSSVGAPQQPRCRSSCNASGRCGADGIQESWLKRGGGPGCGYHSKEIATGFVISDFDYYYPGGLEGKATTCNAGDPGSIPESEDPLEKKMAAHSRTLAGKIPWT